MRSYRFAPEVGSWQIQLTKLARNLVSPTEEILRDIEQEAEDVLDQVTESHERPPSTDRLRYAFALSLLHDILSVGGKAQVFDSEIFVSWPDWEGVDNRDVARRALTAVSGRRHVRQAEARRLESMFASSLDKANIVRFFEHGQFWLEPVDSKHPSGVTYREAFAVALRLWNMPYKGRQGRQRRFVVVGSEPAICPAPVIVGLIEVGDEAPYSPIRDGLLAVRSEEFLAWCLEQSDTADLARLIAERMRMFRSALLPISQVDTALPLKDILEQRVQLFDRASGQLRTWSERKAGSEPTTTPKPICSRAVPNSCGPSSRDQWIRSGFSRNI